MKLEHGAGLVASWTLWRPWRQRCREKPFLVWWELRWLRIATELVVLKWLGLKEKYYALHMEDREFRAHTLQLCYQ